MGTEKQRIRIIEQIKNTFLKIGLEESIFRKVLTAQICMEYGVTERKASEYIKVLLNSGFIKEDEFGLWLNKNFVESFI